MLTHETVNRERQVLPAAYTLLLCWPPAVGRLTVG